jgi:hypothetical protein
VASWVSDTAALYARVFRRGAALAVRNWPVGLAVVAYVVLLTVASEVLAPFGVVGMVLVWLLTVACLSSWLSLAEQMVRYGQARLADLPSGFRSYLLDILTVSFLLQVLHLVASIVLAPSPFLQIVFGLATLAFFNAVPELIYLGRYSGTDLLMASYRFIGENWVEWFPPNIVLLVLLRAAVSLADVVPLLVVAAGAGVILSFATIVRGLLFIELTTSGRRAREFQRRAMG